MSYGKRERGGRLLTTSFFVGIVAVVADSGVGVKGGAAAAAAWTGGLIALIVAGAGSVGNGGSGGGCWNNSAGCFT